MRMLEKSLNEKLKIAFGDMRAYVYLDLAGTDGQNGSIYYREGENYSPRPIRLYFKELPENVRASIDLNLSYSKMLPENEYIFRIGWRQYETVYRIVSPELDQFVSARLNEGELPWQ